MATQALQGQGQVTEKRSHLHTSMSVRSIRVVYAGDSGITGKRQNSTI